jgi:hypothetical protein
MFLELDCLEAFFGGAAGGGKSDTLLMAALQYVHVPNYSALILRRDFARLALPGAIMDRAREWLYDTDASWNSQSKSFRFPSGAVLQFGYVDNFTDVYRYASAEFQFIGFDELTEFDLPDEENAENNPYLFMFSRLRKKRDMPVPLRFRSASNPGNIGHRFVKHRFITDDAAQAVRRGDHRVFEAAEGRLFVPAAIKDNPAIDEEEYRKKLVNLPRVMQDRLMNGDWQAAENLQIPEDWLRFYGMRGYIINALPRDNAQPAPAAIDSRGLKRFATVDTAGTSRDKAEEARGKSASWSVVGVWDYDRKSDLLFLRHIWRGRADWGELKVRVKETLRAWNVTKTLIENAHVGPPLAQELNGHGVELIGPTLPGMTEGYRGAKLERAISSGLLTRLEAGRLLLPAEDSAWKRDWIGEVISWSGGPDETCDQIDVSSYAAYHCRKSSATWGGHI